MCVYIYKQKLAGTPSRMEKGEQCTGRANW